MKRLFGTDGIRGVAGDPPLDPATVRVFGVALAETLAQRTAHAPRVVIGRDTRESGPWLRDAVDAGVASRGGETVDAGVITTPGLAFATRDRFDAGVMISASHNPFEDNGLKVFGADGCKLADDAEAAIEARILDHGHPDPGPRQGVPAAERPELREAYLHDLLASFPGDRVGIAGRRLAIDCANGAACAVAPELFRALGADIELLGNAPDGRNINLGCGSLHLEQLAARVREGGHDLGLAFDGDADRCLAVDRHGRMIDGDHILYFTARLLARHGRLRGGKVVATIMSNFWLERRLAAEGITLLRAPVGDKYVLERMAAEGAVLGGEQSGHVIFRELATTGDGLLTALHLLEAAAEEPVALEDILDDIVPSPQVLINVRVREKVDLRSHPTIGPAVADAERALEGTGRVVLRFSGTEPLVRVMVEGDDDSAVRGQAQSLAEIVRSALGSK